MEDVRENDVNYKEILSDEKCEMDIHPMKINVTDNTDQLGETDDFKTKVNMDELLDKEVMGMGKWQFMISLLFALTMSAPVIFPVFANSTPPNRCRLEKTIEDTIHTHNYSFNQVAGIIGPWKYGNKETKKRFKKLDDGCYQYKRNWTKTLFLDAISNRTELAHNFTIVPCELGYVFQLTGNEYPGNTVIEFQTICERAWLTPFSTSSFMLGMAIGTLIGGVLGDRFGRKWTITFVTAFEIICAIWMSFSPNYISYATARFFVGSGSAVRLLLANVILGEITVPRYRSIFVSILLIGYNFIPRALMSLWAYLIPNWRWLNLACMAPSCFFVLYIFLLPESPRWLLAKRRYAEAFDVLQNAYRINHGRTNALNSAKLEFWKQYYSNHEKFDMENNKNKHESSSCLAKFYSHLVWFTRPFQRFQDAKNIMFCIIFITTFVASFLSIILYARSIKGNLYLIVFLNAANSIPGLIISTLIYRFTIRRKRSLLVITFIIIALLGSSSIYTFVVKPSNDIVLILFTNFALVLMNAVTNMCYVYIPELFSVEFKSYAFGLIMGIARFSTLTSSFLINLDQIVGHGAPVMVCSGLLLIGVLSLLLVDDTAEQKFHSNVVVNPNHPPQTNKQLTKL